MAFVRASAWRAWAVKCFITRFSSTLRWSPTNLYFFCSNLFEKIIQIWNKFNYLFCSSASLPFGSWLIRVVRWHTSSWFSVQAAYTLGLLDIFYKKHIIFDWPESKPSCPPWEHPCQWRRLAPEPFSGSLPSPVPSKPKIFILLSSIQTFKFYLNSYCHGALMYNWIRTFVSILCVTFVWPPVLKWRYTKIDILYEQITSKFYCGWLWDRHLKQAATGLGMMANAWILDVQLTLAMTKSFLTS